MHKIHVITLYSMPQTHYMNPQMLYLITQTCYLKPQIPYLTAQTHYLNLHIRKTINLITWLMHLMSSTSTKSTIEWVPPGLPAHEISKERFSFMRLKGLGNF